ncbi:stage II sporulation protein M [Oceanobacillus caeni]|uniref:Membrane protein n=1 Tax=Oceanobacillus caeni TaxID=405946 RepID=A0ABR5MGS5_9BACI|nr:MULTISPECIES: stage II sporulation protein M [Bacillaceae]KKE77531.1 membrane protein [Bacilli bacterium VT-13-104]PZD86979.1 stage II sporulation protein M [Bacilli bacterium]KPH71801.1 membrane protein [Oceanobacillus caeni]MBU8790866.1 stage II sporulation protein M [Oceanobacillus caeni]MCR1834433.1 stage II sporulation protein M [Oceanobacillus caeni]
MVTIPNVVNKTVFKRSIKFLIIAVVLTTVATVITYIINPDLKEITEGIGNNLPDQVKESNGIKKVWSFIVNNGFMVPLQMLILASIPIQFLYLLNIISTVSLPGILFGIALKANFKKGLGIIISTIPHYIFEVYAFCLLAAVLFELNQVVRVKIRSVFKADEVETSLIMKVLETIKIYFLLILPIIIMAAFLETYIADIIFSLFE